MPPRGAGLHGALMLTVYSVHVLAAAAWVGGLPPLLFALAEQRRSPPPEARAATLDILSRYSLMAMVAVSLIVASGIANAGFRVGFSFDRLLDADYGSVLSAKAGRSARCWRWPVFNRFIAHATAAPLGASRPQRRLRASVALELALGLPRHGHRGRSRRHPAAAMSGAGQALAGPSLGKRGMGRHVEFDGGGD